MTVTLCVVWEYHVTVVSFLGTIGNPRRQQQWQKQRSFLSEAFKQYSIRVRESMRFGESEQEFLHGVEYHRCPRETGRQGQCWRE